MEMLVEHAQLLLILGCAFGFFMAWGVGANDVANAMGTSVGSRALTIRQAILIAAVFEFCGAWLAGGEVTATIRSDIVDANIFAQHPDLLVLGMISALLAAGIWLLVATAQGWPVSTTHSIVGAIAGFASVGVSVDAVNWGKVLSIMSSWVVSPVFAGVISYLLFTSVQKLILGRDDPFRQAKRFVPFYMFYVGAMLSMVTLTKGLSHIGLDLSLGQSLLLSFAIGLLVMLLGIVLLARIKVDVELEKRGRFRFANVERVFGVLMIFTACSMAFAHGSNDVANAVGPLAAIVSVINDGGVVRDDTSSPSWILLFGAVGIVAGLSTFGYRVIATIGEKITELTPSRGFAAELGAASTVVIASGMGLPVSTTHTLVGAVLGVGLARGIGALNLRVIGGILVSWLVTLPAGAILSLVIFLALRALL
ncbi:MAG TPA: inorganic phosphate transporter [Pseudomonadales bacterium]|nr:inorganic phosphate transporter [Pseudomonadales bacterium]HND13884.1 inorganic phosphate transporter [Pseudomonadales bacterium]